MDASTPLCPHCRQPMPPLSGRQRITVDRVSLRLYVDDQEIRVTPGWAAIAERLANAMPRALSRDILLNAMPNDREAFDRTIDSHVKRLRKLLRETQLRIETVYGSGYRFYFIDEERPVHPSIKAARLASLHKGNVQHELSDSGPD